MTLKAIPKSFGEGGLFGPDVREALVELQGLSISAVAGAAAGVKMNIAAMRTEDTILAAILQGGVTVPGVAEVQHIAVMATGGTWTITWNGQTTGAIAWDAAAAAVQAALEGLSNIAVGDVAVTGGPGDATASTPYVLTWAPYLGDVAQPTTDATALTDGGGGHSATPSTITAGVQQQGGLFTDDKANITIQDTHASGTLTFTGLPVAGETVTVNDVVYTFRASPTVNTDIKIGTDAASTAINTRKAINAYETRWTGSLWSQPAVVATDNGAGVVTVTSVVDGVGNGVLVTGNGGTLTAANSGTAVATLTAATAINGNTFTVAGVTFTITNVAPVALTDVALQNTDAKMATAIANAINEYVDTNGTATMDVVASSTGLTGVVTLKPKTAKAGNIIALDEAATNVAKSGAALANGTATGGIKSTTDLTGESLVVYWFNKNP